MASVGLSEPELFVTEPLTGYEGQILGWHHTAPDGSSTVTGGLTTIGGAFGSSGTGPGSGDGGTGTVGTIGSITVPGGGTIDRSGGTGIGSIGPGAGAGLGSVMGVGLGLGLVPVPGSCGAGRLLTGGVALGAESEDPPPPQADSARHKDAKATARILVVKIVNVFMGI